MSVAARWEADRERFPNMDKSTFVGNELFGHNGLDDLFEFLRESTDLHGQTFESTIVHSWTFQQKPHPDREGWTISRADLSAPHIVCRIQVEVVTDGYGKIVGEQRRIEEVYSGGDDW